jgi:SAM-dependent methyltransferase
MNRSDHIPYHLDTRTKFAYYEMLWKKTAIDLLSRHIPKEARNFTKVIDVGCGRGEMIGLLQQAEYHVEGFDADPECVKISSQYGVCKQGTFEQLCDLYPENSFDVAVSLHVIEHLENPKVGVEQLKRISKKYILLATPNLSSFVHLRFSRSIGRSNLGHISGWNYSHLANFLSNICHLRIVDWGVDCVRPYDTLPYLGWLDHFFHKTGIRSLFEERILKQLFPRLSNSLIVLTEKEDR